MRLKDCALVQSLQNRALRMTASIPRSLLSSMKITSYRRGSPAKSTKSTTYQCGAEIYLYAPQCEMTVLLSHTNDLREGYPSTEKIYVISLFLYCGRLRNTLLHPRSGTGIIMLLKCITLTALAATPALTQTVHSVLVFTRHGDRMFCSQFIAAPCIEF